MSSVLSYNDLNLAPVLEEGIRAEEKVEEEGIRVEKRTKSKDETLHETTFMKQFFYFLIMLIMNAGYEFTFSFYSKIFQILFQLVSVHSPELQKHNGDQRCKWKAP